MISGVACFFTISWNFASLPMLSDKCWNIYLRMFNYLFTFGCLQLGQGAPWELGPGILPSQWSARSRCSRRLLRASEKVKQFLFCRDWSSEASSFSRESGLVVFSSQMHWLRALPSAFRPWLLLGLVEFVSCCKMEWPPLQSTSTPPRKNRSNFHALFPALAIRRVITPTSLAGNRTQKR